MEPTPREGDILVSHRQIGGLPRFDIGVFGSPTQYTEDTYERALNRADSFARSANVDVWFTADGTTYRRMTQRRT